MGDRKAQFLLDSCERIDELAVVLDFDMKMRGESAFDIGGISDNADNITAAQLIALLNSKISAKTAVFRSETVVMVERDGHAPESILIDSGNFSVCDSKHFRSYISGDIRAIVCLP